jgi:hypothetical protein
MSQENFTYQATMQNSNGSTAAELHPLRQVPILTWDSEKAAVRS